MSFNHVRVTTFLTCLIAVTWHSGVAGEVRTGTFTKDTEKRCNVTSRVMTTRSALSCARACLEEVECTLVSYSEDLRLCEVSDTNDTHPVGEEAGWSVYYKIEIDNDEEYDECGACPSDWRMLEETYLNDDEEYDDYGDYDECPGDWRVLGESCYYLEFNLRSHVDAEMFCSDNAAHLANLKTEQINFDMREHMSNSSVDSPVWTGALYNETEGQFYWKDGSAVQDGYMAWSQGEPNGIFGPPLEECVVMYPANSFFWVDIDCGVQGYALCEKD